VEEDGESLELGTKRKSPRVVGKLIDEYEIVLIAKKARNRRSPQITVNKIKDVCRTRRRRKRKANMETQLAAWQRCSLEVRVQGRCALRLS
jgi:hypothetical protein